MKLKRYTAEQIVYVLKQSESGRDDGVYRDHVELHPRKRDTWVEKISQGN